MRNRFIRFCC